MTDLQQQLLDAIIPNVVFDGWTDAAFERAADDVGVSVPAARAVCPRGATDLAVAYHKHGDDLMLARIADADMSALRYSEKVAAAIRFRLEVADKELVRRGTTLFSLPHLAPIGGQLIWGTADAIWNALGDTSDDYNWYSKRTILSGVYGSCVLFWLGDDTGGDATREFIDRRIENVMQFEKFKTSVKSTPVVGQFASGLEKMLSGIKRPSAAARDDLPGRWTLND